jgi:hypothetical protein
MMWLQNHMICEVVEVLDDDTPQVELPGAGKHQPLGLVTIKFKLPVSREGMRPGVEPMLTDFICVPSPKSEEVLDRMMSRGPAILPRKPS